MLKEIFEQFFLVPWDQILNILALIPNAGPTQTHAGCRWTPYGFLDHVEYVFLKDNFVVFQSILQRCARRRTNLCNLVEQTKPVSHSLFYAQTA